MINPEKFQNIILTKEVLGEGPFKKFYKGKDGRN
jgi:hypothetical protein